MSSYLRSLRLHYDSVAQHVFFEGKSLPTFEPGFASDGKLETTSEETVRSGGPVMQLQG